jgi:hypothetical protein
MPQSTTRAICGALAACLLVACDPTEHTRPVTIRNDTSATVVLRICDSFTCNNLNDQFPSGESIKENVSMDFNPNEFLIVDMRGKTLGCLDVATHPVPNSPVNISAMEPCRSGSSP